jgi:hypothetical protein
MTPTAISEAIKLLLAILSDYERKEIFDYYCTECGSDDPSCQCWNDE